MEYSEFGVRGSTKLPIGNPDFSITWENTLYEFFFEEQIICIKGWRDIYGFFIIEGNLLKIRTYNEKYKTFYYQTAHHNSKKANILIEEYYKWLTK